MRPQFDPIWNNFLSKSRNKVFSKECDQLMYSHSFRSYQDPDGEYPEGIYGDMMRHAARNVPGDMVSVLRQHEHPRMDVHTDFGDQEYNNIPAHIQFKVACAACARASMSCECVASFGGVQLDHLKFISRMHNPVIPPYAEVPWNVRLTRYKAYTSTRVSTPPLRTPTFSGQQR